MRRRMRMVIKTMKIRMITVVWMMTVITVMMTMAMKIMICRDLWRQLRHREHQRVG